MTLQVSIVSAEAELFSGEAFQVVARTTEGEIGLLQGHEPLLGILSTGEVRVTLLNGEKMIVNADGGFISFEHNVVTVVAGKAHLVSND
ncbi:MAG: F0F1 ATP synthase subunit epsilon [Microbacteriaceae bacterium]